MRRELILFVLIGAAAFAVDVGVLYVLKSAMGVYGGRAASFACAVIFTWLLNRRFTFGDRPSGGAPPAEFVRYFSVMLVGGGINYLVYVVLVTASDGVARQPVWGVAVGSGAGLLVNFSLARALIFNKPPRSI